MSERLLEPAALEATRLVSAVDIERAIAAAAAEAQVDPSFLAGFPEAAAHAAAIQGRIESVALDACSRAGREAAETGARARGRVVRRRRRVFVSPLWWTCSFRRSGVWDWISGMRRVRTGRPSGT
jgi:hypothetical protein